MRLIYFHYFELIKTCDAFHSARLSHTPGRRHKFAHCINGRNGMCHVTEQSGWLLLLFTYFSMCKPKCLCLAIRMRTTYSAYHATHYTTRNTDDTLPHRNRPTCKSFAYLPMYCCHDIGIGVTRCSCAQPFSRYPPFADG